MKFVRIISFSLFAFLAGYVAHAEDFLGGDDLLAFDDSGFDLPEFDSNFVPVVLTATRIQQHQSDVPASVTILDSDFITRLGTNNLAEVLRYVPGIMMGPDRNNNVDSLNYHGGESALPKNLQVLVDGRSMYRAGLASVSWYEMPVALADIDRIEVVRGPNSASYGANAYQAVINILTKHPSDTYGTAISVEAGEYGQEDIFLRQGGRVNETDYRISYTQKRHEGFDSVDDTRDSQFLNAETFKQLGDAGELELSLVVSDAKRDQKQQSFQTNQNYMTEKRTELGVRWTKDFNSKHQLSVKSYVTYFQQGQKSNAQGVPVYVLDDDLRELFRLNPVAADGESTQVNLLEAAFANAVAANDPTVLTSYYLGLSGEEKSNIGIVNMYTLANTLGGVDAALIPTGQALLNDYVASMSTELTAEEYALMTNIAANYSTAESAYEPVAGTIDAQLDEFRVDVEIQDTYIYSPELTFVSGVSFRRDVVDSDHYFDGTLYSNTSRLFGSVTYQPTDKINLHFGMMAEKEEVSDLVFAPRAAINYKISPSESIRYVYSESVRSPDFFEQFATWTLTVENPQSAAALNGDTYYQVGRGPGMIDHQKIVSNEIGYYGRLNDYALELDVRLFHEEESNVLYQTLSVDDFIAENDNTIDHTGIEWQIESRPLSDTLLRMTAAYVEVDTSREDNGAKLRIYAKETSTISWMQDWGQKIASSLNYSLAKGMDGANAVSTRTNIERLDGRISKGLSVASLDAEVYLNVHHDLSSDPYIWSTLKYKDDTRAVIGASFSF